MPAQPYAASVQLSLVAGGVTSTLLVHLLDPVCFILHVPWL